MQRPTYNTQQMQTPRIESGVSGMRHNEAVEVRKESQRQLGPATTKIPYLVVQEEVLHGVEVGKDPAMGGRLGQ